ncbi:signal recognition particle-docking protein FtsY [Spiroplasma endosymbiont of Amphibalanus improvisus]|uniref:signal recognition particle-docking protein FtsY n=1 Tax=Spiroplasma endosymbiont of Amphibalanus improvisus TaxID=3066327 RepID=UPI00313E15B6
MGLFKKIKEKISVKKNKYEKGLNKSSLTFAKEIKKLNKKYQSINSEYIEDLQSVLISSDLSMDLVLSITKKISDKEFKEWDFDKLRDYLFQIMRDIYKNDDKKNSLNVKEGRTNVILVVGVNGSGKTTSIAKLANLVLEDNKKVLLVAADTFRAGAIEQLDNWAKKLNVDIVKPSKPNQDPASVVFDGLAKAKQDNYDLVIIDTAGRLQNKINLMKELEKINKIIQRAIPKAPHETLLVLDAITGQNGISQADNFLDSTKVTGVILTKMDGTARGGIALAIKHKLNIPIKFIGLGEKLEDLQEFDIDLYLEGLIQGFNNDEE